MKNYFCNYFSATLSTLILESWNREKGKERKNDISEIIIHGKSPRGKENYFCNYFSATLSTYPRKLESVKKGRTTYLK